MRRTTTAGLALGLAALGVAIAWPQVFAQDTAPPTELDAELPTIALAGVPFDAKVRVPEGVDGDRAEWSLTSAGQRLAGGEVSLTDDDGDRIGEVELELVFPETGEREVTLTFGAVSTPATVRVIPGWLSILPPLLAIVLAIAFRQVVLALVSGVWLGALFAHGYDPFSAVLRTADTYAKNALADADHASVILFSLLLGGMIGVITRSNGGVGLARLVTRGASKSRGGLLSTWILGIVVFFDDYANALLVGSTMRPVTDRLRISREKLSFVVDATAAPVSSLALVSSWIGVEVGYIADQYDALGLRGDAYVVFIETLPYRFYPLLMLAFGLMVILMRRDFGPMLGAERRAREHGKVSRDEAATGADLESQRGEEAPRPEERPADWINAVAPIGVVVITALGGMWVTGFQASVADGIDSPTVRDVFGNASSYSALLWASLLGSLVGIAVTVGRRSLGLGATMDAWLHGVRSMVLAMIILVMAWSLGSVCRELHTAQWIISSIGGWLAPSLLPAVVFVVAALVSFATGTSWGTMAILFPLVIPMAHELGGGDHVVMLGAISSILAGSVWGDHCSPISDTTIMSSMATSCDHIDHVRTQLPYALLVGVVSLVLGDLMTGLGVYPAWVGLLLGGIALYAILRFYGKRVPDHEASD